VKTTVPNHLIRIEPEKGWAFLNLNELWNYRDLIYLLVWREIKGRYRQMALGPLWIVIQPLMSIVVFSVVFGRLAQIPSDGIPYPVFAFTALLPWQLFATAVNKSAGSLVANMNIISKVYFPRMVVPIASVFTGLVDFGLSFGILLAMMLFFSTYPTLSVLFLPFYIILAMSVALAVGLWLASLSVRFRDVSFAVGYIVQLWFYATPVVYPMDLVPERWLFLYRLNPMTEVIEGFRWSLLARGHAPDWISGLVLIEVILLLVSGAIMFRRTEGSIVDHL
jgi:lipopolysaccharide transport system permease protein